MRPGPAEPRGRGRADDKPVGRTRRQPHLGRFRRRCPSV